LGRREHGIGLNQNIETKIHLRLLFLRITAPGGLQESGEDLENIRLTAFPERRSADLAAIALRIFQGRVQLQESFSLNREQLRSGLQ
jgi:hypothetical protein